MLLIALGVTLSPSKTELALQMFTLVAVSLWFAGLLAAATAPITVINLGTPHDTRIWRWIYVLFAVPIAGALNCIVLYWLHYSTTRVIFYRLERSILRLQDVAMPSVQGSLSGSPTEGKPTAALQGAASTGAPPRRSPSIDPDFGPPALTPQDVALPAPIVAFGRGTAASSTAASTAPNASFASGSEGNEPYNDSGLWAMVSAPLPPSSSTPLTGADAATGVPGMPRLPISSLSQTSMPGAMRRWLRAAQAHARQRGYTTEDLNERLNNSCCVLPDLQMTCTLALSFAMKHEKLEDRFETALMNLQTAKIAFSSQRSGSKEPTGPSNLSITSSASRHRPVSALRGARRRLQLDGTDAVARDPVDGSVVLGHRRRTSSGGGEVTNESFNGPIAAYATPPHSPRGRFHGGMTFSMRGAPAGHVTPPPAAAQPVPHGPAAGSTAAPVKHVRVTSHHSQHDEDDAPPHVSETRANSFTV